MFFKLIVWKSPSLRLSTIRQYCFKFRIWLDFNIYFIHPRFILSQTPISFIEFLNPYWYSFTQLQTSASKYLAQLSLGLLWVFPPAISNYDTSQLCHNVAVSLLVIPPSLLQLTLIERCIPGIRTMFLPNYYLIGWANCINILIEDSRLHSISDHGVKLILATNPTLGCCGLIFKNHVSYLLHILTYYLQLLLHSNQQCVFDK